MVSPLILIVLCWHLLNCCLLPKYINSVFNSSNLRYTTSIQILTFSIVSSKIAMVPVSSSMCVFLMGPRVMPGLNDFLIEWSSAYALS